jgi:hypothetical protein
MKHDTSSPVLCYTRFLAPVETDSKQRQLRIGKDVLVCWRFAFKRDGVFHCKTTLPGNQIKK